MKDDIDILKLDRFKRSSFQTRFGFGLALALAQTNHARRESLGLLGLVLPRSFHRHILLALESDCRAYLGISGANARLDLGKMNLQLVANEENQDRAQG